MSAFWRARWSCSGCGGSTPPRSQPESGPVAEDPLEVVQQAPIRVAPDVDAVGDGPQHPRQGVLHVGDALIVIVGANAVLGDEERDLALGVGPRPAQARLQAVQPEDVAACIALVVALPPRVTIEDMVVVPTRHG